MNILYDESKHTDFDAESRHAVEHIEQIGQILKINMARRFKHMPISMRDIAILSMIRKSEIKGKPITSSDISRNMSVSRSAVSQFVSSLQNRGYIIGKSDKSDKRKTYLHTSDSAKDLLIDFNKEFHSDISTVRRKMGSERFDMLLDLASEACRVLSNT